MGTLGKIPTFARRITVFCTLVCALFLASRCHKAGLEESSASLNIVGSYRVAEEKVDYVFFEMAENPEVVEHAQWFYALDRGDGDFSSGSASWKPLDLSAGVHLHTFVDCGPGVKCGSFSWPSDINTHRIGIRMLYNPENTAELATAATIRDFGTTPSAMLYGVFDSTNSHVQVRVEDNFGIPSRIDVRRYGMSRQFQVRVPTDTTIAHDTMKALRKSRNDNYLFPADFCNASQSAADSHKFIGWQSWLSGTFDPTDGTNGTCMNVDFMDKSGNVLVQHTAFARRNPRFQSGSYNYHTPLTESVKLPIIIAYCADAIGADQARDANFFDYQREIIGFGGTAEDLCIRVGGETAFRTALTSLLSARLAAAKAAATSTRDFVFTFVLHQNISTEFRMFHQIIAEEMATLVTADANLVSPRLVGGFVYDSRGDFRPSGVQEKLMVWCPHDRPSDPSSSRPLVQETNCIVTDPFKIGNAVLNFVTPMGPFPTMDGYKDYVRQYSDKGIAKKPELTFDSVLKNGSTFSETGTTGKTTTVSYFDNEHLIIGTNDHVRTCWDKSNSSLLSSMRLRLSTQGATTAGVDIVTASTAWDIGQGTGDYRIGVSWEIPFIGKITYKSAVTANIVSLIPISRDFDTYQMLADTKWTSDSLDFGSLLQVCKEYCDHPVFDEGGTYQISANFNDAGFMSCVSPKYPVYGE